MIMDTKFIRHLAISVCVTALVVYIIYHSYDEGAYLMMSALAVSSFIIGYLEPRRGWILALTQILILVSVYLLRIFTPASPDMAMFGTFAGCGISLVFSFVAGRIARLWGR